MTRCGVVAIGRNEGDRLRKCLASVSGDDRPIVYVDSGSTDGSAHLARQMGADVVDLDLSTPFTAARARNSGIAQLLARHPSLDHVQFVDGDCEVIPGWLDRAEAELDSTPRLGVVCGRRLERFPEASVYNRLCHVEWNTPVGDVDACGGDAMIRVEAFSEVAGYNPTLIAGEEPELCLRLRRCGWKIRRIDADMTLHDAAITRFSQWWKRARRAGHAYAEGATLHGSGAERHWVHQARSGLAWGLALPACLLAVVPATRGLSFAALLAAYGVLILRVRRHLLRRGFSNDDATLSAVFCAIAKLPEVQGQVEYHWSRLRGERPTLIEYKS